MRNRIIVFILSTVLMYSCSTGGQEKTTEVMTSKELKFPERAANMNIYEVNIRQYTPEGTFNAFIPHIDRLSKMGVDILWIMPIQPIGVENRKGPMGSPYSIQNYTAVNPDFGTIEDFKSLVKKAHDNNMLVILDWVANHTAWDHSWMENNPEYYTRDENGNAQPPVPDWSDVADLNYENNDMQNDMIESLKFWVTEADLDGYRCDVAGEVPMPFWNKAKAELNKVKDLFMLAEWDEPVLHDTAFHMTYGWGFHHELNNVVKGEKNADSIDMFLQKDLQRYGKTAFRMNFTSNHDENSWNGTVYERMGDGALAMAVIAGTVQGMPLIYSGQEAALNKRLSFFDKDSIDWSELKHEAFYTKLLQLKKDNKALWNGEYGAVARRINANPNVYAFKRVRDDNTVICVVNITDQEQVLDLQDASVAGTYMNKFDDKEYTLSMEDNLKLKAWEYLVFTN